MLDGLNPSAQMMKKFWLQKEDCVNGNDFIHEYCRSDAAR